MKTAIFSLAHAFVMGVVLAFGIAGVMGLATGFLFRITPPQMDITMVFVIATLVVHAAVLYWLTPVSAAFAWKFLNDDSSARFVLCSTGFYVVIHYIMFIGSGDFASIGAAIVIVLSLVISAGIFYVRTRVASVPRYKF